jgi:uncharacterized ion transporter superfamily protein YfcC
MKLRVPHTFALLFGLIVLAAVATHFIPAGSFDRVEHEGRELVVPESYHAVAANPAGFAEVFLAFPKGLMETAHIVFYIFLIGGAFAVINATGAIEALIHGIVRACRGNGEVVIAVLVVLFSLGGATIGMAEETLVFLPALVVLSKRLGYDEITAGAIALVGAGAGFAGAFLNPFTVGVAQDIAGLPVFSGLGYRLVVWVVITAITVLYIVLWSRRRRTTPAPGEQPSTPGAEGSSALGLRTWLVLAVLLGALAAVVVGATSFGWGIFELSGLFVAVAILAGVLGGLGANRTAERFVEGAAAIAGGALVVGLARGVLVIFEASSVTDTILYGMASAVRNLPADISIMGIYGIQVLLNFLVPSGSGQAALSIPILAPLADLVGVTRQTTVLAYQFGDGFTNVFTPTQGYFMAGLALIKVPWEKWVKFIWPLQCIWIATGLVFLLISHWIHWGPF